MVFITMQMAINTRATSKRGRDMDMVFLSSQTEIDTTVRELISFSPVFLLVLVALFSSFMYSSSQQWRLPLTSPFFLSLSISWLPVSCSQLASSLFSPVFFHDNLY